FNSFHIVWKDNNNKTHKESFNPYTVTLKQAIQKITEKLQTQEQFLYGKDELITLECTFKKCHPPIPSDISDDALLHDIYKHFPHYPIIQVYWEISAWFMVPYERTIVVEGIHSLKKQVDILPDPTPKFNPFFYISDLHNLHNIENALPKTKPSSSYKNLLHEIINNGYLCNLLISGKDHNNEIKSDIQEQIKKQLHFNKYNAEDLVLDENVLTIMGQVKELYHSDIHKLMGYPLQLHEICSVLLYCGGSCNFQFGYDQLHFQHHKWQYLDMFLLTAIKKYSFHERKEESRMNLYCGLKEVRLQNIEKDIKEGYFISHFFASDDLQTEQMYRTDRGCILHFHPSMRRAQNIFSCNVSWISPHKYKCEILFLRSFIDDTFEKKVAKGLNGWKAKVKSEDENTQMIILTWIMYDIFIQQSLQISAIWNNSIDLNLIYIALEGLYGDIEKAVGLLVKFEKWKTQYNGEAKYTQKMEEFQTRRCCNHHVNLFCMFLQKKTSPKGL
ncbi:hypothetical protein RFI_02703, partial [Reticulomyxa filosa]